MDTKRMLERPSEFGLATLLSASFAAVAVAIGASTLIDNIAFERKLAFPSAIPWYRPSIVELFRFLKLKSQSKYIHEMRKAVKGATLFYVRASMIYPSNRPTLIVIDPEDQAEIMRQEGKSAVTLAFPDTVGMIHGFKNMQNLHGNELRAIRKLFSSFLSPKSLKEFLPIIIDYMHNIWDDTETKCAQMPKGETIVILDSLVEGQFYMMADILFGLKLDGTDEMKKKIEEVERDFGLQTKALFAIPWQEDFKKGKAAAERNQKFLGGKLDDIIETRRGATAPVSNAFEAIADGLILYQEKNKAEESKEKSVDMGELIHDNLLLLFEASHTTTATVTTAIMYFIHLPNNVEALKKLQEELRKLGNKPTLDDFSQENLPYTHGCIMESMRLSPIVSQIGYRIPEGKRIQLRGKTLPGPMDFVTMFDTNSLYDAEMFPQPNEFVPERWIPESGHPLVATERAKAAFRPFGMGRHVCLGQKLGLLVMRVGIYCFFSKPRAISFDPNEVKVEMAVFPSYSIKGGLPGRVVATK